jgi:hypothetical protein
MTRPGEPIRPGPVTVVAHGAAAYLDRRHPRVARFFLGFRFGGLRTLDPSPALWVAMAGTGVLAAASTSHVPRAIRPPRVAAGAAAGLAVWTVVWRWDARRWARAHVSLVPDLPVEGVQAVAEALALEGVHVELRERRGPGGPVVALRCRIADLRRVNAALDAGRSVAAVTAGTFDEVGRVEGVGEAEGADGTSRHVGG